MAVVIRASKPRYQSNLAITVHSPQLH